jgi:hypothetical protein
MCNCFRRQCEVFSCSALMFHLCALHCACRVLEKLIKLVACLVMEQSVAAVMGFNTAAASVGTPLIDDAVPAPVPAVAAAKDSDMSASKSKEKKKRATGKGAAIKNNAWFGDREDESSDDDKSKKKRKRRAAVSEAKAESKDSVDLKSSNVDIKEDRVEAKEADDLASKKANARKSRLKAMGDKFVEQGVLQHTFNITSEPRKDKKGIQWLDLLFTIFILLFHRRPYSGNIYIDGWPGP